MVLLWTKGRLSATSTQQLAAAAIADGCDRQELAVLASFGSWGNSPGNCSRDLKHHLGKEINISAQMQFPTKAVHTKTAEILDVQAAVVVPHKLCPVILCFNWV
jgi:hypothetical protein